jgi:hypothetical protein
MSKANEIIELLEKLRVLEEDNPRPRGVIDLNDFLIYDTHSVKTIAAKVADGIGKTAGEITIDMITEIVDGGKSGIVPKIYFEVFERRVRVGKYNKLEDAVNDYNGRTGE